MIKKLGLITLLALIGCSQNKENKDSENQLGTKFKDVKASFSGVDFSNDLSPKGDLNIIEYLYYYNGGGVALGDINNDGLDDIYFTANQKADKLYLNKGNLKFEDISLASNISKENSWSTGVTMVDINNDGLLDIYVCKVGNYKSLQAKNELYINQGNNTFKEQAKEYGLDFSGFSTQASFFDYDKDGDVDMYLLNHSVHSTYSYGNKELRNKSDVLAGDILFENQSEKGQIKFKDVTKDAGIYNSALGYGLAITTTDVNQDGFIDIYVGNDFHENDYLYINNGDKTFTESSESYFNHTSRFTMGVDSGDLNNDTKPDIITLDMMPYKADVFLKSGGEDSDKVNEIKKSFGFQQQYSRNHLQLNHDTYFKDVALFTNTHATDWSWSPLILDYNNDGLNDIYITNGIYKRPNDLDYINYISNVDFAKYTETLQDTLEQKLIDVMPTLKLQNVLFTNKGDLKFNKSKQSYSETYSNGAAYSDLDLDGDLDIVVNNINEKATILENKSENSNYLTLNIFEENKGLNSNGTKLYLFANGKTFYKEQHTVKGFLSSSTRKVHFGLADIAKIDSLQIIWNDNTKTVLKDLAVNKEHEVVKKQTSAYAYNKVDKSQPQEFSYQHKENTFLDYEKEGLIPEKLSTEGPSYVQADFDGDGLKDLFIGGARNQEPVLFMQNAKGNFTPKELPIFKEDAMYEDVDAIALDIDNDNDLDIYALSGGSDYEEGDPLLEDRVYINDGKSNFTKLNATLLATNGGSVSSYDYNNDGLQDLFIGSRSIPNAYGLSPFSYILKNTGNNNFEIQFKKRFGMITDSKWADLNNDGFVELILAGDWMPITVWSINKEGNLENKTKEFGLENTNGMWNVIDLKDLNNDGNLDILAGNTGQNFKWKASVAKPVTMYVDDFDKNYKIDPIIFYNYFGTNVPFATKEKLIQQLPIIKKKFLKYATFAEVNSIKDLELKEEKDILTTKTLFELRSMAFINDGKSFIKIPLPKEAQYSTIEDFYVNGNHIYYTGNFDGFVTELGKSSSNSGGSFQFVNGDFNQNKSLQLPRNFCGRKIIPINKDSLLVLSNNGQSFITNTNK
ncbi:VCBS repeat-containing protein [Polaribacter sp. MED152]|uniref:VCBS repeat-containing protein n=1 Tax=Polaribacter sp. MED152 TaxID=313598 RepID=UPI000068CD7B|nr:VCBS repeat-containing protein [Polaribacter sp. MED152]EAQ42074.1 hypothetical protein MED152_05130 [Polaribacter sp. MED152]